MESMSQSQTQIVQTPNPSSTIDIYNRQRNPSMESMNQSQTQIAETNVNRPAVKFDDVYEGGSRLSVADQNSYAEKAKRNVKKEERELKRWHEARPMTHTLGYGLHVGRAI